MPDVTTWRGSLLSTEVRDFLDDVDGCFGDAYVHATFDPAVDLEFGEIPRKHMAAPQNCNACSDASVVPRV
jgi:hypothetical protein